jgi:hypothetical protein
VPPRLQPTRSSRIGATGKVQQRPQDVKEQLRKRHCKCSVEGDYLCRQLRARGSRPPPFGIVGCGCQPSTPLVRGPQDDIGGAWRPRSKAGMCMALMAVWFAILASAKPAIRKSCKKKRSAITKRGQHAACLFPWATT